MSLRRVISKRSGLTSGYESTRNVLRVRVVHSWLQPAKHNQPWLAVAKGKAKGKEQFESAAFIGHWYAQLTDPDGAEFYASSTYV